MSSFPHEGRNYFYEQQAHCAAVSGYLCDSEVHSNNSEGNSSVNWFPADHR